MLQGTDTVQHHEGEGAAGGGALGASAAQSLAPPPPPLLSRVDVEALPSLSQGYLATISATGVPAGACNHSLYCGDMRWGGGGGGVGGEAEAARQMEVRSQHMSSQVTTLVSPGCPEAR